MIRKISCAGWSWLGGFATVVAISSFLVGKTLASGIPTEETLTYSGTLHDAAGLPIDDPAMLVEVRLWNQLDGGTELCRSEAKSGVRRGHFSIPLPAACAQVIQTYPDVYVEVIVDSTPFGRSKVGAVPYAIEAAHATSADVSETARLADSANAPAGSLAETLDGIKAQLAAIQHFQDGQVVPSSISAADDQPGEVHAAVCVSNPDSVPLSCVLVANRHCNAIGYRAGIFVGEIVGPASDPSSQRLVYCVQ